MQTNLSRGTLLAGTLDVLVNGLHRTVTDFCTSPLRTVWMIVSAVQVLGSDPETNDVALPTVVQHATPEPGSLMLPGTGVIGLAGMLRHGFKVY